MRQQTTMGKPEPRAGETIELTFGAAFTLAKNSGKQPPYNGLGPYLRNGDFLYCRPDGQFLLQTARKAVQS